MRVTCSAHARAAFSVAEKADRNEPRPEPAQASQADTSFSQHTRVQIRTEGTPVKLADPQVNQIQKVFIQAAVAEVVFNLTVGGTPAVDVLA